MRQFGYRENTGQDAADDDNCCHKAGNGTGKTECECSPARKLLGPVATFHRNDIGGCGKAHAHHDTRHHTSQKELAYRNRAARREGENDHVVDGGMMIPAIEEVTVTLTA